MLTPDALFKKLEHITLGGTTCLYTLEKCQEMAPKINKILQLKKEKNALILAHSYVSPEIIYGVADFTGDSYELSKHAKSTSADTIIFCAVKFMAQTAKLLNPNKNVIMPSTFNGCSLADSINASQVQELRKQYPDYTFVCYINTTAEVKAECDVCVTSSNVYKIISAIPNDKIYFLPDKLMGQNVINELKKRGVQKDIQLWDGTCYVHEEYDPDMIRYMRSQHQNLKVVSHPECSGGIVDLSDFVGSTSQMIQYVKNTDSDAFFLLTECGLTSRLQLEVPQKTFVGSCTMCKYMKSNSLDGVIQALENPLPETVIRISDPIRKKAVRCIDAMFSFG